MDFTLDFTAFEELTAAHMDTIMANLNGLKNGSAFDAGAITPGIWTNPYCFRGYGTVSTVFTDATFIKVTLGGESYDYNNNFSTVNSSYTAPVAGVYHFDALVTHNTLSSSGVEALALLYKNGSRVMHGNNFPGFGAPGAWGLSGDILLAANDVIELYFYQDSSANESSRITNDYDTWLSGHLVHKI